ncbi:MAG: protein SCO1/2, partial [Alteromonadaceae bacterium]
MRMKLMLATAFMMLLISADGLAAKSRWGADYFPNPTLITDDGKEVKFFDDLIKDKVVAINFIYTTCPDTCPLETAQLAQVQKIMGDRIGKDVHIYSITIDPEVDTPEVLKRYKAKFGAKWQFLTGDKEEIINIRRKLGLYIEEIQDDSNNHNVSMIIGNQATGQWMKRSPFENPHVLAEQLGNWLQGWKAPPKEDTDTYANAPELRAISKGEQLFRTRCATCHTVTGKELAGALGPDLKDVGKRREPRWLLNWLRAPDQMLKNKDPIALELFAKYNNVAMPNMRLNQLEARDLIGYIAEESEAVDIAKAGKGKGIKTMITAKAKKRKTTGDSVAVMNAWVREAHPTDTVNAGYFTLINVGSADLNLLKISSEQFKSVEIHEMKPVDGMMSMSEVTDVVIPANG